MAEKKAPAKKSTSKFTAEEQAAMKARARELKAEERANRDRADGERDLLAAIAEMKGLDQKMAKRIHAVVTAAAPDLWAKTWYGMPAYAKDGNVVCFYKPSGKFKARYSTLGFSDKANLDDGTMWPTEFALTELNAAAEKRIGALVKKAVA